MRQLDRPVAIFLYFKQQQLETAAWAPSAAKLEMGVPNFRFLIPKQKKYQHSIPAVAEIVV
ncbi:MAG: hypothetical protein CTY34_09915 [Methylobacter sp.]|nr:MAG: hypothetical protein CTY34_09915 [Methylobacter sp.]PPD37552.1 MAG: hypothetical protein CTY18_01150 [Methylomonas sp.]